MKIVKRIQLKIVFFTAEENRCILHGRVFVMRGFWYCSKAMLSLFIRSSKALIDLISRIYCSMLVRHSVFSALLESSKFESCTANCLFFVTMYLKRF